MPCSHFLKYHSSCWNQKKQLRLLNECAMEKTNMPCAHVCQILDKLIALVSTINSTNLFNKTFQEQSYGIRNLSYN